MPSSIFCFLSMLLGCNCRYSFFVAGLAQTWHWGFHSCNGLSADGDHDKWGGPYEVCHCPSSNRTEKKGKEKKRKEKKRKGKKTKDKTRKEKRREEKK